MIRHLPDSVDWWMVGKWILIVSIGLCVYVLVIIKLWNWFLSLRGETPEQEKLRMMEEDEEQARYLQQYAAKNAPAFTEADKAFFRMLKAMVPEGEGPKILFIPYTAMHKSYNVRPGGFVLVSGPYDLVTTYFKYRHWERLPFMFRERHIYRKPR
jgi:hypothetical protein